MRRRTSTLLFWRPTHLQIGVFLVLALLIGSSALSSNPDPQMNPMISYKALAQDTDTALSQERIEIRASGSPCKKLVGQICTITVGETLSLNVTASIDPTSEQVKLTVSSSPSFSSLSFEGAAAGSVSTDLRFTPPKPVTSITVTFIATSVSMPNLSARVSTSIRVVEKGAAVPPTQTDTDSGGQTPQIELPPLTIGTVQSFIVILTDCNTNNTLKNSSATFTPTKDESSGELKSMTVEVEGFKPRVLTALIKQEISITVPGTGSIPFPLQIRVLVFTASDTGAVSNVLLPNLGTIAIGSICLHPLAPDIEVKPSVPDVLDFGTTPLDMRSGPKTFVLKNVGTAPLDVLSIKLQQITGPFELESGRAFTRFTLQPGEGVTLTVFFTPTGTGIFTNNVVIESTDPDEKTVIVPLRGTVPRSAKITGFKFEDLNGNGVWDFDPNQPNAPDNEPRIPGWEITLTGLEGISQSTLTDTEGQFEFSVEAPGTYTIAEEQREGWQAVTPESVTRTVRLEVDETIAEVHFGNHRFPPPPYRITGCKFWDMNRNQQWDDTEPGLNFWTIHLDGPESATTITDITGCFTFTVNTPGTYTVWEGIIPDWEAITPDHVTFSLPQETEALILFGNDVDP